MNLNSTVIMKDFMATHTFGVDYTIEDLYNLFATLEIKDIKSLLYSPDDFFEFVSENIPCIKTSKDLSSKSIKLTLERFTSKLIRRLEYAFSPANAMFAKTTDALAPKKHSNILDIGSGEVPASSIITASLGHKVTSQDALIILPKQLLENLDVSLEKSYFDKNSKVNNFDFVVGKYPCNAILPIVEVCSQNNTPYLIKLCNHNIPNFKFETLDWREGWKRILPDIDKYIKFYDEYAFNIDLSESSVQKIIDEFEKNVPKHQKQSIFPLIDPKKFDLGAFKYNFPLENSK